MATDSKLVQVVSQSLGEASGRGRGSLVGSESGGRMGGGRQSTRGGCKEGGPWGQGSLKKLAEGLHDKVEERELLLRRVRRIAAGREQAQGGCCWRDVPAPGAAPGGMSERRQHGARTLTGHAHPHRLPTLCLLHPYQKSSGQVPDPRTGPHRLRSGPPLLCPPGPPTPQQPLFYQQGVSTAPGPPGELGGSLCVSAAEPPLTRQLSPSQTGTPTPCTYFGSLGQNCGCLPWGWRLPG